MTIAIITGASSGIGAEFCRRLDQKGLDCIWLVARRQDRLEEVASSLRTPSRIFSVDLADRGQLDSFLDTIRAEKPEIGYLINCAGFGKFGETWALSPEITRSMIDLDVTALVMITSACVPFMPRGSHIIELCSLSAYIAMDDLNVYASSKAFVRHFCNGLRHEVADKGISVTEVSPGWVRTEFIDVVVTESNVPEKVFANALSREAVVDDALRCADKGKKRSICGLQNRFIASLSMHFPNFAAKTWSKRMR
jgi:hypothetical protein